MHVNAKGLRAESQREACGPALKPEARPPWVHPDRSGALGRSPQGPPAADPQQSPGSLLQGPPTVGLSAGRPWPVWVGLGHTLGIRFMEEAL